MIELDTTGSSGLYCGPRTNISIGCDMVTIALSVAGLLLCLLLLHASTAGDASVLNERVLGISSEAAKLSSLAYANATEYEVVDATTGDVVGYEHPDYEEFAFYTVEPDQAILAKKDGRCYVSFRGTTNNIADWIQNLDPNTTTVYRNDDETQESCQVREGFAQFTELFENTTAQVDVLACVASCQNPDDCLVLTGHSQGAASATITSILLHDFNPIIANFGSPTAIGKDCTLIPSEKMYRYVNTIVNDNGFLKYDPVAFLSTPTTHHYGHYLLMGDDMTAAKYVGFDDNYTLNPNILLDGNLTAHDMGDLDGTRTHAYEARVAALLSSGATSGFPVSDAGFSNGFACDTEYVEVCASGSCQERVCANKTSDLCIFDSCVRPSDCESDTCVNGACASGIGMVDGGCPCESDGDCNSGACNTDEAGVSVVGLCIGSDPEETPNLSPVDGPPAPTSGGGERRLLAKSLFVPAMMCSLLWNYELFSCSLTVYETS